MPSLIDKLLDIIGLLPIGKLLRIGRIARIIARIRDLQSRAARLRHLLRRIQARMREAAERLARSRRAQASIREQAAEAERRLRARGATDVEIEQMRDHYREQMRAAEADARAAREQERLARRDEAEMRDTLVANQDLIRQILQEILGMILPMDLLRSLATLGGMAVAAGFAAPSDRRSSITGALALGPAAAAEGQVLVLSKGGVPVQATTTGPGGDFAFSGLPEGDYQVLACTYPMQLRWVRLRSGPQNVLLESGFGFPAEIRVQHKEAPLGGVTLAVCELREGFGVPAAWLADLGSDGSFCTRFTAIDSRFVLLPYAGYDLGFTLLAPRIAAYEGGRLDAVLHANGGCIAGRISSAAGSALAGARVDVVPARGEQREQALERQNCARVFTNRKGEFEARYLDPGDYLVVCSADGHATSMQRATIALDGRHCLDLRLDKQPQGGSILGQLTNPYGEPSSGYAVAFTSEGQPTGKSAFAGADGLFLIEGLAPGKYQLATQGEAVGVNLKTGIPVHGDCPTETRVRLAQLETNLAVGKSAFAPGERVARSPARLMLSADLLQDDEGEDEGDDFDLA